MTVIMRVYQLLDAKQTLDRVIWMLKSSEEFSISEKDMEVLDELSQFLLPTLKELARLQKVVGYE